MARRNNNNKNTKNQSQDTKTVNSKDIDERGNSENLDKKLDELIVNHKISEVEIKEAIPNAEEIKELTTFKSAQELYHKVLGIERLLEKKKVDYDKLIGKITEQQNALDKEKASTELLKIDLTEKLDKYNEELTEINRLRVEGSWASVIDKKLLDRYDEQLKEQEEILLNKIKNLTEKHTEYISSLQDSELNKLEQEKEFQLEITSEKERLKQSFNEKLKHREDELDSLSIELEERKTNLVKKQKQLEYDIEDFSDEKNLLIERAKQKVAQEIESSYQQLQNFKDKNKSLSNELLILNEELKALGSYKAKDIIVELRKKETELFQLREQVVTSPDTLNVAELKKLQKDKNDWQNQLRELGAQLNDYKSRYENQKLQIGEKERLEFQKEELEQRIKLQQYALEEIKEDVLELTSKADDKTTFVSCTEMDEKYGKSLNRSINNKIGVGWMDDIKHAIAQITENKLYYDDDTIRSFIAGLAMSRFSILQGISGTGKTSLPKAFAQAIGGNFGIVEVQSGWKDRQDLIGYYNTFEKKYYEGKFLKWLYMAGTPDYCDKPFFIILDEMNLSHPEHYFADLLSVMEETNPEKQILTISDKVKDRPKLMFDLPEGGIGLKIPQNVWFIGTANNDETTLQFAAKTYDRANVLEMPASLDSFDIKNVDYSQITVSNTVFLEFLRFSKFDEKSDVLKYLNGDFKNICNKLERGWGNRLEKQIKLFIPVFKALGGNEADALDHIIASKILRSIEGQYGLEKDDLNAMNDELSNNFEQVFGGKAKKSLKIVNKQIIKED